MRTRLLAWASWVTFLVSAISEWGFDVDLPLTPVLWLVMAAVVFFATNASAALTTNSWTSSLPGNWHDPLSWSAGVPSNNQALVRIVNSGSKVVVISAATATVPGTMTISNLLLSASVGSTNGLQMFSSGTNVPLRVLNSLTITDGGELLVTNAVLQVDGLSGGEFAVDGSVNNLAGGQIVATNVTTVIGTTSRGNFVTIGGTFLATNVTVGLFSGSQGTLTLAGGTNLVSDSLVLGHLSNATGAVWVTGGLLVITNTGLSLIGDGGVGQMTVSNGTVALRQLQVGSSAGSQGTLTVAGGTNTFDISVSVANGPNSTGTVWVTGGLFNALGGIDVGFGGAGSMTLSNGTFLSRGDIDVAPNSGSRGTLTMAGGLLVMTNTSVDALTAGLAGHGEIFFSGGTGLVRNITLGGGGAGTGTLWVTGGQLTVTNGDCKVGNSNTGLMTMSNGLVFVTNLAVSAGAGRGTLTMAGGTNQLTGSLTIGSASSSSGAVWLTGGRLVATNAVTSIGASGNGRMTISNGIFLASAMLLGPDTTGRGTLTVSGGTLACAGPVVIGSATGVGTLTINGGQFTLTNTPATVSSGGTGLIVDGTMVISNGSVLVPSLTAIIGSSGIGDLTAYRGSNDFSSLILGAFTRSVGTLRLLGGTNHVSGTTSLGFSTLSTGTVWFSGDWLDTAAVNIGASAGGIGLMNMSGGVWRSTGQMNVGQSGSGTLTVAGGTLIVANGSMIIPNSSASRGAVWLTGGQVIGTNSLIGIGNVGPGALTVSNGVLSVRDMDLSIFANGAGIFTVAGGTNSIYRNLNIGTYDCQGTGVVNVTGGSLFVTNAGTALLDIHSGTVTLSSGTLTIDKLVITNACGHFNKTGGTLSITTTNLAAGLDADGDGLPNDWEQSHGLSPLDATGNNGAAGDPDGDGFSNLQEYLAGSNPHSAASVPDAIWINGSSGKWEVGGNWLIAVPPTNNQSVFITNASPKTVTIDTATPTNNMSIKSLTLGSGNTLQITNTGTAAPLRISNDASIAANCILSLKNAAASVGTLFIDPFGSLFVTNGSVSTFSQEVQGEVSLVDSIVTNQPGGDINVASILTAELWMSGGSLVCDFSSVSIGGGGLDPGTTFGLMTVSNGFVSVNELDIGLGIVGQGVGTLTCAGGTTKAKILTMGNGASSMGTVWVTGGQLIVTNVPTTTTIGILGGSGRITVSNGTAWLQSLALGDYFSSGTITIDGGAVYATNVTLGTINCTGTGTVSVAGGSLFVTNAAFAATLEVRNGTVALNSGTLTVDRLVITNGCGHFVKTGGTLIQNNPPVLGAGLDADGDGLPNDWEQAHGLDFLDPNGVNGATGDPDGDGFTNLQEFQRGTDPQDPNSTPFRITSILQQGNDVLLTWATTGRKTNVVQATFGSSGSYSNNFADISGNIVSNVVGLTSATYLDVGAATNFPSRYYRVRLVP